MPLVQAARPGLELWIYGAGMPDSLRALASDTVHPEGFVPDIAEAYDRHRIFVAPLLSGAGIKGKVLAALAHGVPCVLSPVAAEGIGLRHGLDCMIARTPQDWADAIAQLSTTTTPCGTGCRRTPAPMCATASRSRSGAS